MPVKLQGRAIDSNTSISINTFSIGSNINANTTTVFVGNSTVNTSISAGTITINGVNVNTAITGNAATAYSNAIAYSGNAALAYANATTYASNADNISSGTLNTARLPATVNVATILNVGANSFVNTSAHFVGNSTVNSVITSTTLSIGGNSLTVGTTAYYTSNGFIGLGTSSPNAVIEAVSPATSRIAAGQYSFVFRGENNNERLAVRSSADAVLIAQKFNGTYASPTAVTSGQNLGGFQAGGYTGAGWSRGMQIRGLAAGNWSSTDTPADITFQTVPVGSTSLTDRVTIGANGNVGIGTTTPGTLLQVVNGTIQQYRGTGDNNGLLVSGGDANNSYVRLQNSFATVDYGQGATAAFVNVNNNQPWYVSVSGASRLWIANTGNIGIGTTSPSNFGGTNLNINSPNNSTYASTLWVSNSYVLQALVNEASSVMSIGARSNHKLDLCTNDTTRVTIAANGNVGIGATSPGYKLEVSGNIQATYLRVTAQDAGNEGGEIQLVGAGAYDTFQIDNYQGNARIHTLAAGKVFQVLGGNILANGCPAQVQYTSSGTRVSVNSTAFTEPSTNYRVTITPKQTNSMIKLTYFIPMSVDSAVNTLYTIRAFRILSGVTSYALTSAGGSNGSRNVIAGVTFRPNNGFDSNDTAHQTFTVIDFPSTTSACTYGFEFKRETGGAGTAYFGYSAGDSSNWGFDADIVIIAEEIGQ